MSTKTANEKQVIEFDAAGRTPGRLAVEIANTLRGKNSPSFLPHIAPNVTVIAYNTDKLSIDPKKAEQKTYYRHSEYPGGIYEKTLGEVMEEDSRIVLHHAVKGMLPKNKLARKMLKNLKLYKDDANTQI